MTRIAHIAAKTHRNQLGGKVWNPAIRWTDKYAVFVEIETEDGAVGLGECWCFDAAPDALLAFLRTEVAPHFLGRDVDDADAVAAERLSFATLSARHGMLRSALSGVDIALWDLRARRANAPLWRHLNAAGPGAATLYASGGLYAEGKTPDRLAAEMSGFAAQGFRLSKMKIGALEPSEDVARVDAVLAALPADARLIVDAVYRYDFDTMARIWERLPHDRIEAVQSPVRADDYAAMARLVAEGVPVMAVEAEYRTELHRELIERGAVRFLQTAPIASGGVTAVRALSSMVAGTAVALSLEVSSTAIALTAAVQLAAADAAVAHVERHSVHDVFFDGLSLSPVVGAPGVFRPPAGPGLGAVLPEAETTLAFRLG